ncbi:MAG: zinc-finger domain-containing protein [Proteobacteria bacterium]|nr:zinc-finger domain-containing protein [Pseudomonadota bacterium]
MSGWVNIATRGDDDVLGYNSPPRHYHNEDAVAARAGTVDENLIPANAQHEYAVRSRDLPLSCPMPGMYLWNSHPKVFLPIESTGEAKCPYCGAQYRMTSDNS